MKKIARTMSGLSLLSIVGTAGSLETGRLSIPSALIAFGIALTILVISVGVSK